MRRVPLIALVVFVGSFAATAAHAQRTFVASYGVDTNLCTRQSPCRNLNAAIAAAPDGGEVVVLDSAGYGPLDITKSVSVSAPPGVYAGITAPAEPAISIHAAATADVAIRGLTLNGTGASYGVLVTSAGKTAIERCVISGFASHGVLASVTGGTLSIDDTVVRENAFGIAIASNGASVVFASVGRCLVENNTASGVFVQGTPGADNLNVTVHDTVSVNHPNNDGIRARNAVVHVKSCVLANNSIGLRATLGSVATVSDSTVVANTFGLYNDTSTLVSFGNNHLSGNSNDKYGTVTVDSRR